MRNIPNVKLGIVAVSRGCFPKELSISRRVVVVNEYKKKYGELYECSTCAEEEKDIKDVMDELKNAGCNGLVIYLGNFGPETTETLIAKAFWGPIMFIGASEESQDNLIDGRGDAYCGMLNASYNLKLRNIRAYIPSSPIGTAEECADMIAEFMPIANIIHGINNLKIISFGPRPQDFLACNAPIKQLYNLNVEIEENSELDLLQAYKNHGDDERIPDVVRDMEEELGEGNKKPEILTKLAQFELTLLDWVEEHKGSKDYVAIASKCWPAFELEFGFVPCYVNSRLTSMGIPVACEVDIYGALSEFIAMVASKDSVTLLDINNTVPKDLYLEHIRDEYNYSLNDVFMGFHCGNAPSNKLSTHEMKYHKIMAKDLTEEFTKGTLEGDLIPGEITIFRLQSTADAQLNAYIAQGEILPVASRSFGSIGIIGLSEMERFYRHVLIEKNFPHHGVVAFGRFGKILFDVLKYLGVNDISYNQPKGLLYESENPFS